jgi:thiopeptide-type bacteriocin biosynthesis protein
MQTLGKSAYISFDWMDLQKMFTYFPRVQVGEHIILSPETWRLKNKELNIVIKESNDEQIISVISNWRKKHQIPEKVIIIEGDNELLIDLTNVLSIKTMLLYVKNKPNFIISEFIFDPENPLLRNNKNEIYTNEIIRSLHRTGTVPSKELSPLVNFKKNIKRSFILGSEWIYYKIYCGDDTADSLLISRFKPMIESFIKKGYINKWFFVRYNDPHKHLRIRFSVTNQTHIADVISTIRKILQSFQDSNNIWKIQTETYIRELERYGMRSIDDVEQIFFEDSMLWLNIYNSLNDVSDSAIILSVLNINQILNDFQLSSNEKFNLMENIKMAFYSEFEIDKKKKLNIDKLYREKKGIIFKILAERTEQTEMLKIFRNHQVKYGKKHYHNIITLRDKGELEIPLNSIIASLIHMSMNRIFPKDQRLNELFIYDFVSRYYKTKLFLEK